MKKIFALMILFFSCLIAGCSNSHVSGVEVESTVEIEEADSLENIEIEEETELQETEKYNSDLKESSPVKGQYSGWICGLVSNEKSETDSDVVVIQPETKEVKVLATLEGVYQLQACAVSPDGNNIAYTKWIDEEDTRKGVCIVVDDLVNDTSNTYFNDNGYNPLITYISWMPDNTTLLCNISLEDQQYYSDVVFLFNTKTEELQVIDKGKVWQGKVTLDIEKQIKFPALNQEELNALIDKYGGNNYIPVEENGRYNYVEFGMPILSPSQKKIMYVTNFCRNSAYFQMGEAPAMLCLASGIYIADMNGQEEPELVYRNSVEHSRIGKVIWGRNDNEIIFDRYYNEQSRGTCDLVKYNIDTEEEKIFIKSSAQMETQKARFMVGKDSIGICSDGETGEGLYYYDLSTDTYEKESIIYNGKELSLWRFCEIY